MTDTLPACPAGLNPNPGTGCIGSQLDGWPNRDLNVGMIIALAPNLQPIADVLNAAHPSPLVTVAAVRQVPGPR